MRYFIVTYGCQMNEADSSLMAGLLERAGWERCASAEEASLLILNTCSVREKPEQKVYSRLGELRGWKQAAPSRMIAVTGCMAQREGARILQRAPYVDLILGTRRFHRIEELASRVGAGERPIIDLGLDSDPSALRCQMQDTHAPAPLRAYVPVILGCSNFCAYCIVPFVRGREASRLPESTMHEVESLVRRGCREVTLLGQNVLAYGRDLAHQPRFADLLRRLGGANSLWRIRFTTCHPRDVSDDLISAIADVPAVCEHIHLPVQAGTDRLLWDMKRGYTTGQYEAVVRQLRASVPGIAITTDIMVGFPGETDDDFQQSLEFYEHIGFDGAFMFAYSPRPGTAAVRRPGQVARAVRLARLQKLISVQNSITQEHNHCEVGRVVEVLVDGPPERGKGLLAGRARSNKLAIFPGQTDLTGSLVQVRLRQSHVWGFDGELVAP